MNILFRLRESIVGKFGYKILLLLLPPVRLHRKVWGLRVFFNLRDCLFYLAMSRTELESLEGSVLEILKKTKGPVWDVGCNVGLFSLYCASHDCAVTAFDISDKSIQLLEASAAYNNLDIRTVPTALSMQSFDYIAPGSAHTMNSVSGKGKGVEKTSMTLDQAVVQFGVPKFIKMDIEGAELEFFQSIEFKQWISENRITLLVEMHSDAIWGAVWPDIPSEKIDDRHVLISFDRFGEA
jgi:FkbM family methyltransferase